MNNSLQSEVAEEISIEEVKDNIHDIANMMPLMDEDEKRALEISLRENGQTDPIVLYRDKVVDGRNRINASLAIGNTTIKCVKLRNNLSLEQVRTYVLSKENRRKQTKTQLAITALALVDNGSVKSDKAAAERIGVSPKQVQRAKKLRTLLSPKVFKELHDGYVYTTVSGSTTSSLETIIVDLEKREQMKKMERLNASNSAEEDIRFTQDYKDGEDLIRNLVKGKSDAYIRGMDSAIGELMLQYAAD